MAASAARKNDVENPSLDDLVSVARTVAKETWEKSEDVEKFTPFLEELLKAYFFDRNLRLDAWEFTTALRRASVLARGAGGFQELSLAALLLAMFMKK